MTEPMPISKMKHFSPITTREGCIAIAVLLVVTLMLIGIGVKVAPILGIDLVFVAIAWIVIASRASARARKA